MNKERKMTRTTELKGYEVRVNFKATRYENKISKTKEQRLKEINKQIDKLSKEVYTLFK